MDPLRLFWSKCSGASVVSDALRGESRCGRLSGPRSSRGNFRVR
jgi:hypothetical protein